MENRSKQEIKSGRSYGRSAEHRHNWQRERRFEERRGGSEGAPRVRSKDRQEDHLRNGNAKAYSENPVSEQENQATQSPKAEQETIYGRRPVVEALRSGVPLQRIYVLKQAVGVPKEVFTMARDEGIAVVSPTCSLASV